jgi:sterol 3beta-glucosyltransferase
MSSLGDVINRWRKTLGLEAIDTAVGAALARELKIPFTYCWSPSLVPKPFDWPSYIGMLRPLSLSLACSRNE